MDKKDEALKLALEALEFFKYLSLSMKEIDFAEETITAIRVALASKSEALAEQPAQCRHRIADARNPVVTSGYLCVDCGALFSAADHTEQPAQQQEPVAWVNQSNLNSAAIQRNRGGQGDTHTWSETPTWDHSVPLYTSPPASKPWVGLTDEDKAAIYRQADEENWHDQPLLEAVEAKLREKNA